MRIKLAKTTGNEWGDYQLDTSDAYVFEDEYPTHSRLFDKYGNNIPYENPKQDFVGFRKLS